MSAFDDLLMKRAQHDEKLSVMIAQFQRELDAAWIEAALSKSRRSKIATVADALRLLTFAESTAVKEPFAVAGDEAHAAWTVERNRIDAALRQLALTEPVSVPEERTTWMAWRQGSDLDILLSGVRCGTVCHGVCRGRRGSCEVARG